MPYDSTGLKVDLEKLPKFDITGTNESGISTTITLSNTSADKLIRLSSSIKSRRISKVLELWKGIILFDIRELFFIKHLGLLFQKD